jgi:hypothetical protein
MIIGNITPAIFQEALRQLPYHKAPGPDNIPDILLKQMPNAFHKAIYQLFQAIPNHNGHHPIQLAPIKHYLAIQKNDPYNLDIYRPITLANALYKLCTSNKVLA